MQASLARSEETIPAAACDNAEAAGDVRELVTYAGADHFVFFTRTAEIQDSTALFLFEQVLWPLGYRVEHVT